MGTGRDGLRRRREQLDLSQEAAAVALGVATSTYRSWEAGTRTPRIGLRRRVARVFEVSLVEVDRWFNQRAVAPSGVEVPAWLDHFITLEQGAAEVRAFEPMVVPGLLQIAAYATALRLGDPVPRSPAEVDAWVSYRLARQDVLTRRPEPLRLSVVIDESVLLRPMGGPAVMAAQLDHLIEMGQRPNIDLRVLPLDAPAAAAVAFGAFNVLRSPGAARPYMAHVEDRAGSHYLDRRHDVERHVDLFDHVQRVARSPGDSVDLIRSVSKERYS